MSSEDHVRELFGDRVELHTLRRENLDVTSFEQARDYGEFFKTVYGGHARFEKEYPIVVGTRRRN